MSDTLRFDRAYKRMAFKPHERYLAASLGDTHIEDPRITTLRRELADLMREQNEALEEQAFIPLTAERVADHERRLKRIREVSAELIALWAGTLGDAARDMNSGTGEDMGEKAKVTVAGKVEKIIERPHEPKKAEIALETGEPLYQEIRIENTLQDPKGNEVELKPGAEVDVKIEADETAVKPKDKDTDGPRKR